MKFLREGPDSCLGHLQFVSEDFQLLIQQTRILHHIREVQFLPQPYSLGAPFPGSSTACHLSPVSLGWANLLFFSWTLHLFYKMQKIRWQRPELRCLSLESVDLSDSLEVNFILSCEAGQSRGHWHRKGRDTGGLLFQVTAS